MVESTYNWYWLVDGLMDTGYSSAPLANPAAIKQHEGLKYSDDQHDAFFLAQLLILGILPKGYIYPKNDSESTITEKLLRQIQALQRKLSAINWLASVISLLKIKFLFVRNCSVIKPFTTTIDIQIS